MSDILEIVIRAFLTFILLMGITHFIGKQIISQMTTYQFVAVITLGSIAGNMVFNIKIRLLDYIVALLLFSSIIFAVSYIDVRTRMFRKFLSGEPTFIIKNGNILEQNMRKLKITLDSLKQSLRHQGVFNIQEIEHALVEADGTISIQKKPAFQPVIRQDIWKQYPTTSSPIEIIIEGKILEKNLILHQLTKEWLLAELAKRGIQLADVFYGVKGSNGTLYFDLYRDHYESKEIH